MGIYPSWAELSQSDKNLINNGCGPSWMSEKIKVFLNDYLLAWMFFATCGHHDYGYLIGGTNRRRLYCDCKFAYAMWKDVRLRWNQGKYVHSIGGFFTGAIFFLVVLVFGVFSFEYGPPKNKHQTLEHVRSDRKTTLCERMSNFRW